MRIDSLEVEREVVRKVMKGRSIPDVFLETKFPDQVPGESPGTYLKRTVSAVRRLIRKHLPKDEAERVAYICELLELDPADVLVRPHDESDEAHRLISVTTKRKGDEPHQVVRVPYPAPHDKYEFVYLHLYRQMKPSYHRTARKFRDSEGGYVPIADLESYLAEIALLKALDRYVQQDPGRLMTALFDFLYDDGVLDLDWVPDEVANVLRRLAADYGVTEISDSRNPGRVYTAYAAYADGSLNVMTHGPFFAPFHELMPLVLSFVVEVIDMRNLIKDAATEKANFAKAFQTKKHIPKTHRERMEDNRFLDVYGYVELDEDVDLEKFAVIEENFVAFAKATDMPPAKNHDFRIKRLGNYRAAGMYFSGYNTTIFDLRHPEAFGHEWMHQIDHTWGIDGRLVHEESRFHPLLVRYQRMVEQAVGSLDHDDPFYVTWKGGTKYNRSYYMKKTEVFARLGEVYLSTIVDDDNSLVKPRSALEASPVHPTDDVTLQMVVAYYQELFERFHDERQIS